MLIDVGQTTLRTERIDYIEKWISYERCLYGLKVVFFGGSHTTLWFKYEEDRDDRYRQILRHL